MRESDLIRAVWRHFPRSPEQKNRLFSTDAEIVTMGNELWAITLDEFSVEEDGFGDLDTPTLGHNLVAATLSDLVAVGATPRFFLHSLALPPGAETIETLSIGISETLNRAGTFLLGGDVGQAASWRYAGVALGSIESGRPVTREVPMAEQTLWVTGQLGAVNLAMLHAQTAPRLTLHSSETQTFIARYATACIDTSGGLVDALWTLHEQSPGVRFEVEAEAIPYDPQVVEFATSHGLPPLAFLFGGAGEYELLFTTPADFAEDQLTRKIGATRIGRVTPSTTTGLCIAQPGKPFPITEPPPCAREYPNRDDYIQAILTQMKPDLL